MTKPSHTVQGRGDCLSRVANENSVAREGREDFSFTMDNKESLILPGSDSTPIKSLPKLSIINDKIEIPHYQYLILMIKIWKKINSSDWRRLHLHRSLGSCSQGWFSTH